MRFDGSIKSHISDNDIERILAADAAKTTKLFLTVGGGGRSAAFSTVVKDGALRRRFANNLADIVDKFHFNGLDFDWESPSTSSEMAGYLRLLAEVRSKLGDGVAITVALHAGQYLPDYSVVDGVNLMSYDLRNSPKYSHSEFNDVVAVVDDYITNGKCPKEKIILGLSLYGRNPTNGGVKSYSELVDLSIEGAEAAEDDLPLSQRIPKNWRVTTDLGGFYFDGVLEAQRKTQWAIETGLGGVFFWEVGQDKDEHHVSVIEAVGEVVNDGFRLAKSQMAAPAAAGENKETLLKTAEHLGSRADRRRKKKKDKEAAKLKTDEL